MKSALLILVLLLVSCGKDDNRDVSRPSAKDETDIEGIITSLYAGLDKAYNAGGLNTDSLIDVYYDHDVRYVTPWGNTEPLDTTKARLRNARNHLKNYNHRVEALQVKSYGNAAYANFVLRQNYDIDGSLLDEYLPTTLIFERRGSGWKIVHAHRSTDYQTMQEYAALQQKRASGK